MTNQEIGSEFEKEFCEYLKKQGYWVHFIERNKRGGQPFDVIACRKNLCKAYDCKTNKGNLFRLSRIEDNQELAFTLWSKCKNTLSYFIIKQEETNKWFLFDAMHLINLKSQGIKSVELTDGYLYKE